ncbi:MAG: hypothetical protein H5T83_08430 [Actinotalea sp.]|nr:hypothetical protein [Actinotalea sp.]
MEVTYATDDGLRSGDALRAVAGTDAEVLAGTIETVAGLTVGRLRLAVPGADAPATVVRLRAAGLHAEVLRAEPLDTEPLDAEPLDTDVLHTEPLHTEAGVAR